MIILLLFACATDQPDCPPCPETPTSAASAPSSGLDLDPWEAQVLRPLAEQLSAGVQPFGDQGFGLCEGRSHCDRFLGAEPGELPPGDYIIRAELSVPALADGWRARYDLDCTVTTAADRSRPRQSSREYDLGHSGTERGYRLEPLTRVHSPKPDGAHGCTFTLTPIRPDGQEQTPLVGHYSTPLPPAK